MATRNRAEILRESLEAFCGLQPPLAGLKLVVIDDGSTDQTAQTINSFKGRLPLQSAFEPHRGKNAALNTGLDFAEGDLTIFTDDDVFPHSDWLVQMRKAADAQPIYSVFGGAILPRWETSPPMWVRWMDLGPIFTVTPPWLEEGELASPLLSVVQGPNMAIRSRVFQAGIRFDPSIGPHGASYPMGSETELLLRLGQQGHKAWYAKDAIVEHLVRNEQLQKEWVLKRAIRWGRGRYRLSHTQKSWMSVPRHLFRDIPTECLLIATAWVSCRQDALFRSRWRLNILRGIAIEARLMAKSRRVSSDSGKLSSRLDGNN